MSKLGAVQSQAVSIRVQGESNWAAQKAVREQYDDGIWIHCNGDTSYGGSAIASFLRKN